MPQPGAARGPSAPVGAGYSAIGGIAGAFEPDAFPEESFSILNVLGTEHLHKGQGSKSASLEGGARGVSPVPAGRALPERVGVGRASSAVLPIGVASVGAPPDGTARAVPSTTASARPTAEVPGSASTSRTREGQSTQSKPPPPGKGEINE
jgi:hypothetical protein